MTRSTVVFILMLLAFSSAIAQPPAKKDPKIVSSDLDLLESTAAVELDLAIDLELSGVLELVGPVATDLQEAGLVDEQGAPGVHGITPERGRRASRTGRGLACDLRA